MRAKTAKILRMPRRGQCDAALGLSLAMGIFAAGAAGAADFDIRDYCSTDDSGLRGLASELVGQWQATYQAGYVLFSGMTMAHPASDRVESGRLEVREGGMALVPDGGGIEMTLDWAGDVTWRISDRPSLPEGTKPVPGMKALPDPVVGGQDLALIAGCDLNDLPRMVGTGSMTQEGITANFTLRAIVVDENLIYGFQEVDATRQGKRIIERRPMVMSRQ